MKSDLDLFEGLTIFRSVSWIGVVLVSLIQNPGRSLTVAPPLLGNEEWRKLGLIQSQTHLVKTQPDRWWLTSDISQAGSMFIEIKFCQNSTRAEQITLLRERHLLERITKVLEVLHSEAYPLWYDGFSWHLFLVDRIVDYGGWHIFFFGDHRHAYLSVS